jgi:hypothetical protein
VEELREGCSSHTSTPRRRKGNPWFFDYFGLFFAFFFAFGTEITCRSNVAVACLTLPSATKFYPRAQALSSRLGNRNRERIQVMAKDLMKTKGVSQLKLSTVSL